MKKSFIDAGIIEEHEFEHRLTFVTTAKAIAHHQLFLDRNLTGIKNDADYLVCGVGDISVGIAKIHADSSESQYS